MMKRIGKFFLNVSLYVAIVLGLLFGLPRALSWYLGTPYPIAAITSGSMWPALHTGDLVFIKAVSKENLKVGDVVVWKNDSGKGFVIHRVVRLKDKTFVTKGDANFIEDAPVKYEDLVGKTVQIFGRNARLPYFGLVTVYAHKN
ncbi:MAG: signal peptidase I [Patescibacteria group bacterium]